MAEQHRTVTYALSDAFDPAGFVASVRHDGWTVRRGALQTCQTRLLDTHARELLDSGLAAFENLSSRGALDVYMVPLRRKDAPRLLLSKRRVRAGALPALVASAFSMRLADNMAPTATFDVRRVPFSMASRRSKVSALLETISLPGDASAVLRLLRLTTASRSGAAINSLVTLMAALDGVTGATAAWPCELLDLAGISAGPSLAPPYDAAGDDDTVEAAIGIIRRNYRNLIALEPGARLGIDGEYVHNMRVATRRMRAALRMFAGCFRRKERAQFNADLRWISGVLGAVRDLDVYVAAIPDYLACINWRGDDHAFYLDRLRAERRADRKALLEALSGDRYAAVRQRIEAFIADPPRNGKCGELTDLAARGLRQFMDTVLRKGAGADTDDQLHSLRISFKRLRYSVEFLAGISPKRMARVAGLSTGYQDLLGRYTDAVAACRRVRADVAHPDTSRAQAFLLGYLYACQRLTAIDAAAAFRGKWFPKGRKRLAEAVRSAMKKL